MSYVVFNPPRKVEEYPNLVSGEVLEEVARARLTHAPPKYLIKGEWIFNGRRSLDIAINREWVTAVSDHQLVEGFLRYVCPGCGRMSGQHAKGCDHR